MVATPASQPAKKRILSACVRLFIEKGYHRTTVAEIIRDADVSASSFQNIFRAKSGVLVELVKFMFENQFGAAHKIAGAGLPSVYVYAVETSIQLALTELNENLRDIYLEAYVQPESAEFIHEQTSTRLYSFFSCYLPGYSESDFYELEIGSAGIMRGYMARRCDKYFTLEKKIQRFLDMSMNAYKVPEDEQARVLEFIAGLDIRSIAGQVMEGLFRSLAMRFDFPLADAEEAAGAGTAGANGVSRSAGVFGAVEGFALARVIGAAGAAGAADAAGTFGVVKEAEPA